MFEESLARIKHQVEELSRGFIPRFYMFGSPAEERHIQVFEARYSLSLPEEYRAFILTLGAAIYDAHQQYTFLFEEDWEEEENRLFVSCPPFWSPINGMRLWDELTGHEQIESNMALLIYRTEMPAYHHFLLLFSGPSKGEVWVWSIYEPEAKPMRLESGEPMRFFDWIEYLLRKDGRV